MFKCRHGQERADRYPMDQTDAHWRLLRRHRHRAIEGECTDNHPSRCVDPGRHARQGLDPGDVEELQVIERSPAAGRWSIGQVDVRVWVAHNRWHTTIETALGEPQVETHRTRSTALRYAQGAAAFAAGRCDGAVRDGDAGGDLLDDVEVAVGAVEDAIDDMPGMEEMERVLLGD